MRIPFSRYVKATTSVFGGSGGSSSSSGSSSGGGSGGGEQEETPISFSFEQLADAKRIYQRVSESGGVSNKGVGIVEVPIYVSKVGKGQISVRIRSESGEVFETPSDLYVSSVGEQSLAVPVSAGLGWRYIDLSADGENWVEGTTLVGVGQLIALLGQSQQVRMLYRVGPGETQTFATLGLTPSPYCSVFASLQVDVGTGNTPTSVDSPINPSWLTPADANTWFTGAGMTELMNRQITELGINVGVVGHAVGGSVIANWIPGSNYLNQFLSVINKVGGFEVCWFHLGGTDGQGTVSQASFAASLTSIWNAITAANTVRGDNYYKADTGPAYRYTGAEDPLQVNGIRKGGKLATEAQNKGFYYEPQDMRLGDSVHETPLGGQKLAQGFNRKLRSVRAGKAIDGPVLASGVRVGNVVTLTLNMPDDAKQIMLDQYSGNAFVRFVFYPSGTTPTYNRAGAIAATAAAVQGTNQVKVTLDPAATITGALDLWLYHPQRTSQDGDNNLFRDNYTADGLTYGRPIVSTNNTGGPLVIPAPAA